MKPVRRKRDREPTITLINIVFLMLIFFLVAGTVAVPVDDDVRLVNTTDLTGAPPDDALVLDADGVLTLAGLPVDAEQGFHELGPAIRIIPDRSAQAARLVAVARDLRVAGAERVIIVTERGLE